MTPTQVLVMANGTQVLERVDYADWSRLDFTYNGSAQLRTTISNRGYAIVLDYDANGLIVAACGYNLTDHHVTASTTCTGAPVRVSYSYTARSTSSGTSYDLTSMTDLFGQVTTLQRNADGLISCITIPDTQTCAISNVYGPLPGEDPSLTKPNQVRRQTMATGELWQFNYVNDDEEGIPQQGGEVRYTAAEMIDPVGGTTSALYGNGLLESIFAPGGKTEYRFNGSIPTKFIMHEGNVVDLNRDERGNLFTKTLKPKTGWSDPDLVSSASFPPNRYDPPDSALRLVGCVADSQKLCDKPIYTIDPRGHRTDYTYDPAHGGVLTETGPAGPNGIRPQTRYTYQQRHAWIRNASAAGPRRRARYGCSSRRACAGRRRPPARAAPAGRPTRSARSMITARTAAPTICCCAASSRTRPAPRRAPATATTRRATGSARPAPAPA